MAEVFIEGLDELFATFGRLSNVQQVLREPMRQAVDLHYQDTQYNQNRPPKPAGSQYIRTFDMRDNWNRQVRDVPDGVIGEVTNRNHPYVHLVMGEQTQVRLHRGRWPTDEDIVNRLSDQTAQLFDDAVRRAIGHP